MVTLPKFNITPEKSPSQWETSLPTTIFQGRAVKLRGGKSFSKKHEAVKHILVFFYGFSPWLFPSIHAGWHGGSDSLWGFVVFGATWEPPFCLPKLQVTASQTYDKNRIRSANHLPFIASPPSWSNVGLMSAQVTWHDNVDVLFRSKENTQLLSHKNLYIPSSLIIPWVWPPSQWQSQIKIYSDSQA